MGYGRIAVDTLRWDNAGTPTDLDVGTLANTTSPVFTGDVTLTGSSYNVVFDASDNALEFADNAKATFGESDLEIYHNGANSYVKNQTGGLKLLGDAINFGNYADSVNLAYFTAGGTCALFWDGSKKFETTTDGVTVTGTVSDSKGDLRDIPVVGKSSAYTLVASDAGKAIYISTGGVTIPASVLSGGKAVTILNDSSINTLLTKPYKDPPK